MSNPRVSFLILTWNRSVMLKQTLSSLISNINDLKNSEIIIFDNNSSDNTKKIILDFYEKYKNKISIKYVFSDSNLKLKAYKRLFYMSSGDYIVEVDDDVLDFPKDVDDVFIQYFTNFNKIGFLALNVVQNEYTNGAKPEKKYYKDYTINGLTVEVGPTGGWCAGVRRKDFRLVSWLFYILPLSMKMGEDLALQRLMKLLGKKSGIIKDHVCFHASGPYYSQKYDLLDRDIEKYDSVNMHDFSDMYKNKKKEE